MLDLDVCCAMCNKNLMQDKKAFKWVIIDGEVKEICSTCNNKYIPDEIKSVTVMAKFDENKTLIKEYNLGLFLINSFTEKEIEAYMPYEDTKLTKYLRKILSIPKETKIEFVLKVNLVKKRCNKCELCDKLLDFEDSIYFKKGKRNTFIQVCKSCDKKV